MNVDPGHETLMSTDHFAESELRALVHVAGRRFGKTASLAKQVMTAIPVFPLSFLPGRNRAEKRMWRAIAERVARGTASKNEVDKMARLMAELRHAAAQASATTW